MPEHQRTTKQNPTLAHFDALVGEWEVEASVGGRSMGRGRTVFAWLEGGAFLTQRSDIQRSDAAQAEFPSTTAIIGGDDTNATHYMLYFDSRGVSRVYQISLHDGVWMQWRSASGFSQRYTGTFSDDGKTITGRWEKSEDGSHWEHDFDLTHTKVREIE